LLCGLAGAAAMLFLLPLRLPAAAQR
jgi:hypothetical protein